MEVAGFPTASVMGWRCSLDDRELKFHKFALYRYLNKNTKAAYYVSRITQLDYLLQIHVTFGQKMNFLTHSLMGKSNNYFIELLYFREHGCTIF